MLQSTKEYLSYIPLSISLNAAYSQEPTLTSISLVNKLKTPTRADLPPGNIIMFSGVIEPSKVDELESQESEF